MNLPVTASGVDKRVRRGMSIELAMTLPPQQRGRRRGSGFWAPVGGLHVALFVADCCRGVLEHKRSLGLSAVEALQAAVARERRSRRDLCGWCGKRGAVHRDEDGDPMCKPCLDLQRAEAEKKGATT